MTRAACAFLLLAAAFQTGCAAPGDVEDPDEAGPFVPDPDDETVDPDDPPTDPDPASAEEGVPAGDVGEPDVADLTEDEANALRADCPVRSRTLSPAGLTFVFHISKDDDNAWAGYTQLMAKHHLVRARDIFMIEEKSPVVNALRRSFPCNHIHYIAYPDELDNAYAAGWLIDGIAVDWEGGVWNNPPSWSVDKLGGYAQKFHGKGLLAGVVPYWPQSFDDGAITRSSKMNYDLAQIQDHCAHGGASSFADGARGLVQNFMASGMKARDIGFEVSVSSYESADNHTSVKESAWCTRAAYGQGARAIYLYGNGPPHYDTFLKTMVGMGLRKQLF